MRVAVVGAGAVGARVAESLAADPEVESVTVLTRPGTHHAAAPPGLESAGSLTVRPGNPDDIYRVGADVVVVAVPSAVRRTVLNSLDAGCHVVCPVDDPIDVRQLLEVDQRARAAGRTVAIGTAMAPGLSCVLAAHLAARLDRLEELHVASLGTGGPACARRHHAALAGIAVDWEDTAWRRRAGGSGRELVWFPGPVGGADCYRAALADPLLLAPAFPECRRITSRQAATRRDRMTSWLPMLRRPHPEGLVGAVRVEARGWVGDRPEAWILGASTQPAVVAATVSAVAARWAASGRMARPGAAGLAELIAEPGAFLRDVARAGVSMSAFEGAPS
ncbi:MAG TPA: Gfo/Idh/MocA family oxidoreductase [Acidimicrobiales bacterium]|nr:Gfo/Idh/MocA family oxidoreductase [Acidimicrobiales bacterium]